MLLQGTGVLMVGNTEAAASAAVLAIQKALPANCHGCFLAFKGQPAPIQRLTAFTASLLSVAFHSSQDTYKTSATRS